MMMATTMKTTKLVIEDVGEHRVHDCMDKDGSGSDFNEGLEGGQC